MKKRIFHFDHWLITTLTFFFMSVFVYVSMNISFFNPVARAINSFSMTDVYYACEMEMAAPDTSRTITIVDISKLFDRGGFAEITEALHALQPAVIGYDVIFEGLRGDTINSMILSDAIKDVAFNKTKENTPLVFGFKMKLDDEKQFFTSSVHSFFSDTIPVTEGYVNVQADINGNTLQTFSITRLLNGNPVYSFPYQVVRAYDPTITENGSTIHDDLFIDWTPTHFTVIPYDSLWENKDLITRRIVLIGAADDDADKHWTPLGKLSGVEMHAYSIQTLQEHKNIHNMSPFGVFVLSFLIVLFTQISLYHFHKWLKRLSNPWILFIMNTSIFQSFILFLWAGFIIWAGFLIYVKFDLYINLAWMLMGIALLNTSREFYVTCLKTLDKHHNWKLIQNSLYNKKPNI